MIVIPYRSKPRRNWVRWLKQRSLLKLLVLLAWVVLMGLWVGKFGDNMTKLQQQSNRCLVAAIEECPRPFFSGFAV